MNLFQISGSGHSSLDTTPKHWVSWVNTSTTELEKSEFSELGGNWGKRIRIYVLGVYTRQPYYLSNTKNIYSHHVNPIETLLKQNSQSQSMDVSELISTSSFLSLWKAPLRYSSDTSSFSFSHCITNGSNHLWEEDVDTPQQTCRMKLLFQQKKRNAKLMGFLNRFVRNVIENNYMIKLVWYSLWKLSYTLHENTKLMLHMKNRMAVFCPTSFFSHNENKTEGHQKWKSPYLRRVFRHLVFVGRHVLYVVIVQPLNLKDRRVC